MWFYGSSLPKLLCEAAHFEVFVCAEVSRSFPTMPLHFQAPSVTSPSPTAARGNKEAGFSFLTPSPTQWRDNQAVIF